jgi:hypothetical protein
MTTVATTPDLSAGPVFVSILAAVIRNLTSHLLVHRVGQRVSKRHCTLGHQTAYSRQSWGQCYKLADERSYRLVDQRG